ncbi:MAG TPA: ATP-binding protein [Acidimicrobiales bacterium]|nr:ATP-binding protein [Acidimicrobiales bacterium]
MDDLLPSPIVLELPGDSRFMRLARLLASGVATACGLPLEEVEDFRVVVDEVCATLIEAGGGNPIRVSFTIRGTLLCVEGTTRDRGIGGPDADRLALSYQILDVVTESHEFARDDGEVVFTAATRLRGSGVG